MAEGRAGVGTRKHSPRAPSGYGVPTTSGAITFKARTCSFIREISRRDRMLSVTLTVGDRASLIVDSSSL
jgi:hypothetical protein